MTKNIEATIVADSVSEIGHRLTTFVLTYPRMIHAELMTHRMLSRNSSSSRAIPVSKMVERVQNNPAMPEYWGKNQAGMQAAEELEGDAREYAINLWKSARDAAVLATGGLVELGVHKQIANRILEPWHHITVIVTATSWENFFTLRCHKDAQPEFRILAELMAEKFKTSEPKLLDANKEEWHLPFVSEREREELSNIHQIKCSVARCARSSYLNHDGSNPDLGKDLALHDKLVVQYPAHSCYDDQTEVFTDKGWVRFDELGEFANVAAVDHETGTFKFEKTKTLVFDYSGEMVELKNGAVDLLVTPEHRMLIQKRTALANTGSSSERQYGYTNFRMLPASEIKGSQERFLASVKYKSSSGMGTYAQGAFVGFALGDGSQSWRKIRFHLSKKRKIDFLTNVLDTLNYKYKVVKDASHDNPDTVTISLRSVLRLKRGRNKSIPPIAGKSADFIQGLFDGLMESDGSVHNEHGYTFASTSKQLMNDVVNLATLVGREVRNVRKIHYGQGRADVYTCNISFMDTWKTLREAPGRVPYSGKVYCATVSTGLLLVRRNGQQVVCGNSPTEHQARPVRPNEWRTYHDHKNQEVIFHVYPSNFFGFVQYRKLLPELVGVDECAKTFPWSEEAKRDEKFRAVLDETTTRYADAFKAMSAD